MRQKMAKTVACVYQRLCNFTLD